jgi:hypothetical protein
MTVQVKRNLCLRLQVVVVLVIAAMARVASATKVASLVIAVAIEGLEKNAQTEAPV